MKTGSYTWPFDAQGSLKSRKTFVLLAILLIALGIVRSAIATRLDSFTIDEAYHIAAGVTYVKFGDFRINPEHPPLVKLWVGAAISASGFKIDPLRRFNDKPDERDYAERAVFAQNDPDSVQRRARVAMWILNGLLLLALTQAAQSVFGDAVALATLGFLMVDPTVAAHMPVVMTDLPIALTSTIAILISVRVCRDWLWTDVFACSAFLGLALAAKHSAPVILIGVVLAGIGATLLQPSAAERVSSRPLRFLKIGAMLVSALLVLWAFYGFRYSESRSGEMSFNRPLTKKINDVTSPGYRFVLEVMSKTHVVPRAYLWGFADTVHTGMEGRSTPQMAFGKSYDGNAPWFYFPGIIAVKLPIGLGILSILGLTLFMIGRFPPAWKLASLILLVNWAVFLLVLSRGATYGGIRHALPAVAVLAIFGGMASSYAFSGSSKPWKFAVACAYLAACISAIPVIRPWEYFNEFAGGTRNAYKYFADEGLNLGHRSKELAAYYHQNLQSRNQLPEIMYRSSPHELKARGVDYLGRDMTRDFYVVSQPERKGTLMISPIFLMPFPYYDAAALRAAHPVARFGNLFIYSGEFHLSGDAAGTLEQYAKSKLFADKPDLQEAERSFRAAAELEPKAYFLNVELGNVCLLRGEMDLARAAYEHALQYVPVDSVTKLELERQIERLSNGTFKDIPPVRDPVLE